MRRNVLTAPVDIEDRLMDISEAADFFHVTEGAMYKRVKRGRVPSHKVGSRIYFSKKELLAHTLQA